MDLEELFCTICFHFFDDNDHCPRMLPSCGHTFCSRCLQNMIDKLNPNETFTCPEDRVAWPLSKRDITSFPKNFVLIRLIEKRKCSNGNPASKSPIDQPLTSRKSNKEEGSGEKPDKKDSLNNSPHRTSKLTHAYTVSDVTASTSNLLSNLSVVSNLNSISSTSSNSSSGEQTMCKEHNRKLEIVCIDHRCRICTNCGLFGSHKNHEIKAEEEVLKEVATRAECLIDIFQMIEMNQNKLFDQAFIDNLNLKLKTKYDEIAKDYINMLRTRERKLLDDLNCKFSVMEERFKEIRQLPSDLTEKINKWKHSAQDKLTLLSEKTEKNEISFELLEDRYNLKNDILVNGEKLVQELEKTNEIPIKSLEETLNGFSVIFNDNFSNIVDSLCALYFNNNDGFSNNQWKTGNTLQQDTEKVNISMLKHSNTMSHLNMASNLSHHSNGSSGSNSGSNMSSNSNHNSNNPYSHSNNSCLQSSNLNQMILNRLNYKNVAEISRHKKSIDIFNEKLERMAEEGSLIKLAALENSGRQSAIRKFDEENDLLNLELNNFGLADIPDLLDSKSSTRGNSNSNQLATIQEIVSPLNQALTMCNSNSNKPPLAYNFIMEESDEPRSTKLSFNLTPTKSMPVNSEKENIAAPKHIKKKASMKFSEKHEPVIEGLKIGTLETVDLTGAEMGDMGISCLADYITNNRGMKYLKLVRNKITDEGGAILLKALANNHTLQTLNLTQNLMTEKTIEGFLNLFKTNQTIKTIYFNQNSISLRNVKNKIKEISKLGINVSI